MPHATREADEKRSSVEDSSEVVVVTLVEASELITPVDPVVFVVLVVLVEPAMVVVLVVPAVVVVPVVLSVVVVLVVLSVVVVLGEVEVSPQVLFKDCKDVWPFSVAMPHATTKVLIQAPSSAAKFNTALAAGPCGSSSSPQSSLLLPQQF